MGNVFLHVCCGICAFYSIEELRNQGFLVKMFFYNPNIYPEDEYHRRLDALKKVAEITDTPLEIAPYYPQEWDKYCRQYQNEPEGKKRCQICYELRLKKTYQVSLENKYDYFTTTLSISPHKNSKIINQIGAQINNKMFLPCDFKKKDGFKKTIDLAKKHNIYRQNYCGCLYSRQE